MIECLQYLSLVLAFRFSIIEFNGIKIRKVRTQFVCIDFPPTVNEKTNGYKASYFMRMVFLKLGTQEFVVVLARFY